MTETLSANYKGELQQYCQKRGLGPPIYDATQQGTPNEPSWLITITYGSSVHVTPEPITGSKRNAEHVAAKQVMDIIKTEQQAFLAGAPLAEQANLESEDASRTTASLVVPTELVTAALGIANHRLAELRRAVRYREPVDNTVANQQFAESLAALAIEIVQQVMASAEESNISLIETERPTQQTD